MGRFDMRLELVELGRALSDVISPSGVELVKIDVLTCDGLVKELQALEVRVWKNRRVQNGKSSDSHN